MEAAELDKAVETLLEDHRKALGLTFGQVDEVLKLPTPAKLRKLAGMLRVGPQTPLPVSLASAWVVVPCTGSCCSM